ncbi:TAF9B RNA polymerase II, TATA box binding protein (TBP)-associated factor, isoform CRA_a [Mus musculus]|nr:TAF9B RNA polymerase II, TATA box binding protein (TBP)-associated factor, isoform CRA_a [Mus musculus]EDL14056.1 TAF9B RNA polymerase II, TATA box binding protein (TBP)-associated factor, isoform CRA_a [Mus musculus]
MEPAKMAPIKNAPERCLGDGTDPEGYGNHRV